MTPLMLFAAAWMCGIALARWVDVPAVWFLSPLPLALALLIGWGDRHMARRAAAMLIGLALGALRLGAARTEITADHVAFYRGQGAVEIQGVVVAEPDRRTSDTRLRVRVERISSYAIGVRDVEGKLLVYVPRYPEVAYGDRIQVAGNLETPPVFADFSFEDYLAREGIYALLRSTGATVVASHQGNPILDRLLRFKEHAHRTLQSLLPEPQGSLLAGILLGIEQGIPQALKEDFETTGTSHIVAISGFNLTMVAALVTQIARRLLQRRGALLAALLGIWGYVLLVGAHASVFRAGVMSSLIALGQQEQRRAHGPTSLAAAVVALSLANPFVLWDTGFQLSAAATLGMMVYAPLMATWATTLLARLLNQQRAERIVGALGDVLIVTLAVQVLTLGITVSSFRAIPLVAPLTNFLILPAQPFIMVFGGLALGFGLVLWPLGRFFAWIAWVFLAYTTGTVTLTASLPLASVPVPAVPPVLIWGYYLLLATLTTLLLDREHLKAWASQLRTLLGCANPYVLASGAAVVVLLAIFLAVRPDGKLHVVFLDTGKGDAVFIRTPTGQQALIDGGGDSRQTLAEIGRQMPFYDRSLDLVILTSPDDDHLGGLVPVLERYEVAFVGHGPEVHVDPTYSRWRTLLEQRPPGTTGALQAGDVWQLGSGAALSVLWPPPDEQGPLVLELDYGTTRMLLMGDATTVVETSLAEAYGPNLRSQVLQLPRQGAKTCCSVALLQAVAPVVAVVQGDRLDGVTEAKLMDVALYRTAQQGTIDVISDGSDIRIRARR
ncbi:MAG: ComEC/Rec2 family competence protein [Anaerolineae bacterium]|jgi:competence protein ComEC|nr:ComEC/Rec2 family competence protein [Anaerolineae bacterium]